MIHWLNENCCNTECRRKVTNISHGSGGTRWRCGRTFNDFITNLLKVLLYSGAAAGGGSWCPDAPASTSSTCGNRADPVTLSWRWGSYGHPQPLEFLDPLDKNSWRRPCVLLRKKIKTGEHPAKWQEWRLNCAKAGTYLLAYLFNRFQVLTKINAKLNSVQIDVAKTNKRLRTADVVQRRSNFAAMRRRKGDKMFIYERIINNYAN